VKVPPQPSSGENPGTEERRIHRSVSAALPPAALPGTPGVALAADTEILQKLVRQLRMERAFLQTVLDQMPAGVLIAEAPAGRLILANAKLEDILRERFFPALTIDQYDHWCGHRPDGTRYQPREWPLSRALLFGDAVRGELIRMRRGDRSWALLEVNAAPIHDDMGLIAAAVTSFLDVSDRDWARERFVRPISAPRRPRKKS
jgi:PAS domain-containing protein